MTVEELEEDFINVCRLCLKNNELVNEFYRLKKIKRPDRITPIERQIDNGCGYNAGIDFMKQFTEFVREFIYVSLLK